MDIRRGLEGVVVDTTAISLVDGDNGILSYRGIPIDDLVDLRFGEVAALVVDGRTHADLSREAYLASELSPRERDLVLSLPESTHPMHVIQGLAPLLDPTDAFAHRGEAAQGFAIAAKLPTILATFLKQASPVASEAADPAARFLEQIGAPDTDIARTAYNVTQILQIEHSFNASTFVARATASTLAPVENALSAAFGTLHGVLHGGADQAALETADRVGSPDLAPDFVDECLRTGTKVMGMGHREYRVLDPRARYLKALAEDLCRDTPHEVTYRTLVAIEDRFTERMA
ncbi:MAG: citrate/2-methylcitrate synthase, partial [Gammaproteobacteria bacterium]